MRQAVRVISWIGWTAAVAAMSVGAGVFAANCAALGRVVP
jgi:hypothetical protein